MFRDNYNDFVGDQDYYTNLFLRFKRKHVSDHYEKFLLSSATFSLRILLVIMSLMSLSLSESQAKIQQAQLN